MKPQYINGNMRARCPDCDGAISTFESKNATGTYGQVHRPWNHQFEGKNFTHANYVLLRCAGCGRGGVAIIHGNGAQAAYDESFYPTCRDSAPLPKGVPTGVEAEYREAELCASAGAWRAWSALLRSALEKTLVANGYAKGSPKDRIDDAAKEGVITAARRQRAHHYVQRILEDLYDHRGQVEATLRLAGRLQPVQP